MTDQTLLIDTTEAMIDLIVKQKESPTPVDMIEFLRAQIIRGDHVRMGLSRVMTIKEDEYADKPGV